MDIVRLRLKRLRKNNNRGLGRIQLILVKKFCRFFDFWYLWRYTTRVKDRIKPVRRDVVISTTDAQKSLSKVVHDARKRGGVTHLTLNGHGDSVVVPYELWNDVILPAYFDGIGLKDDSEKGQ